LRSDAGGPYRHFVTGIHRAFACLWRGWRAVHQRTLRWLLARMCADANTSACAALLAARGAAHGICAL